MNPNLKLSRAERAVLDQVRHLLGVNLAALLLSGLGRSEIIHCRAFSAHYSSPLDKILTFKLVKRDTTPGIPPPDVEITYRLEMRNDSARGLPSGRDPLVLAVLLLRLVELRRRDDTARFTMSEILERLRWSQDSESQSLVTQAIEKYISTAYCLLNSTAFEEEQSSNLHLRLKRILIGYETASEVSAGRERDEQRLIKVQFPPSFVNAIILTRKHFLGIEFQKVRELREIPC